jgi:hypothetical protein
MPWHFACATLTVPQQAQHRQVPRETAGTPENTAHVRLLLGKSKDRLDFLVEETCFQRLRVVRGNGFERVELLLGGLMKLAFGDTHLRKSYTRATIVTGSGWSGTVRLTLDMSPMASCVKFDNFLRYRP